ncbi:hypothetical protein ACE1B6_04880 [Aerosakkonemataceae cyanobacterium BLCC-F154]|uniref:Uncharacterized protein n=1 Tax=Floridaenema fluviatile BLCC-F154 TaxID=3153640 RepID=A0ABV4Y754_9CYAN
MDINVFSKSEVPIVLGALKTVAADPQALTTQEFQFLQTLNQLYQNDKSVDNLPDIKLLDVAEKITDFHRRKRLLQLAIVMAMVEGKILPRQEVGLKAIAQILSVSDRSLQILHEINKGHQLFAQILMMQRIMGNFLVTAYREQGLTGLSQILKPLLWQRGGEYPPLAERFYQLKLLPKNTLGYCFWQHCTERKFKFPGEEGAIPERLVFHDFGHILSGYDTNPMGEIQQGAFQAGFVRDDGFKFLVFAILQFHWGVKITPVADAQKGLFDSARVMQALQRGAACKVDLSKNWNFWEVVNVPLDELRDRYNIPALASVT